MNYQSVAIFSDALPLSSYGNKGKNFDEFGGRKFDGNGAGIPQMTGDNMTIEDIYNTPFLLMQDHRKDFNGLAKKALTNIQSGSELSKLFFSDENMRRLQRGIKAEVFKRTKGTFKLEVDQEQRELFIVMRAVYLNEGRFLDNNIVRQCKRLNEKVIIECVPDIITAIKQNYGYLKEINRNPPPIARPLNVNNKNRALPSVFTTFGA